MLSESVFTVFGRLFSTFVRLKFQQNPPAKQSPLPAPDFTDNPLFLSTDANPTDRSVGYANPL